MTYIDLTKNKLEKVKIESKYLNYFQVVILCSLQGSYFILGLHCYDFQVKECKYMFSFSLLALNLKRLILAPFSFRAPLPHPTLS